MNYEVCEYLAKIFSLILFIVFERYSTQKKPFSKIENAFHNQQNFNL